MVSAGWRMPIRATEGREAPRDPEGQAGGLAEPGQQQACLLFLSVPAQARPSSQMWTPPMPPAPLALPPPASPTTPGELCRDSGPQLIHLPLMDEDLFCTSRSRDREMGEGAGLLCPSLLWTLYSKLPGWKLKLPSAWDSLCLQ